MKLNTVQRKKFRIRNKLKKNASNDRYRLSVSRSLKNFSAQIIDDVNNKTLLSASSIEKDIKSAPKANKMSISKIVAEKLAKKTTGGGLPPPPFVGFFEDFLAPNFFRASA